MLVILCINPHNKKYAGIRLYEFIQ
uniref:Uncharacterized protein n=1 Tax=Arundo donax TaxID=35708 RepID=A0A0A8YSS3_ARUDO